MKTLTKTFITLLFMAIISLPTISFSQQWSTEQQEVLAVTEKLFEYWAERDLEGFMNFSMIILLDGMDLILFQYDKKSLRELNLII